VRSNQPKFVSKPLKHKAIDGLSYFVTGSLTLENLEMCVGRKQVTQSSPRAHKIPKIPNKPIQNLANTMCIEKHVTSRSGSSFTYATCIDRDDKDDPETLVQEEITKHKPVALAFLLRHKFSYAFLPLILFCTGIYVSYDSIQTNKYVAAQVERSAESQAASENTDGTEQNPSEQEPTQEQLVDHSVSNTQTPKYITIQKSGTFARVKQVDINESGNLAAPTNIFDAGWYARSALPGSKGAMIIDGHVGGRTKPGIFAKLQNLQIGDRVIITNGAGQKFTYELMKSSVFEKNSVDMASLNVAIDPNRPGLNIITCNGNFDKKAQTYDKRLVVYMALVL
jgi:LPXTG-site transpeptidase (sortase) family protein